MRLDRPCLVLTALWCLLTAASASAECAWVLWGEVLTAGKLWGSTTEYVLVSAHPTHPEWGMSQSLLNLRRE